MHCNRNQLADFIGRDVKTIDSMVAKGMPYLRRPGDKPGAKGWTFETADVIRWMLDGGRAEQLKQAELRIRVANAGIKEYEYALLVGAVMPIRDVLPRVEEVLMAAKSRVVALPSRVAQLIAIESDPAKVHAILKDEIDDVLKPLDLPFDPRG